MYWYCTCIQYMYEYAKRLQHMNMGPRWVRIIKKRQSNYRDMFPLKNLEMHAVQTIHCQCHPRSNSCHPPG